ncbi:MAG: thioredoxin family protein [Urechidicola sp.]|nr:thioredoxin family protein [Urechidicola sp.]
MNVVCENKCKQVVQSSLEKSVSYDSYIEMVHQYVQINSTSGNTKSEALVEFTKLNDRRMKRWNKTLKVSDTLIKHVEDFDKKTTWLVITESWCGDAAHILPVINKIASLSSNINMRIVFRDENPELMNNFLTNGGQSIPKLIMVDDETEEVLNTFGPRPAILTSMVQEYKEMHGTITTEFKEEIQKWYNKDKGQSITKELCKLLS